LTRRRVIGFHRNSEYLYASSESICPHGYLSSVADIYRTFSVFWFCLCLDYVVLAAENRWRVSSETSHNAVRRFRDNTFCADSSRFLSVSIYTFILLLHQFWRCVGKICCKALGVLSFYYKIVIIPEYPLKIRCAAYTPIRR